MRKGKLICIMGIDGSGKTTLSKSIIKEISGKKIKVEYRWGKFESGLFKILIMIKNKLVVHESDLTKNYEESLELKKSIFSKGMFSSIYEQFVLIDYIFQMYLKISLPLKMGKTIVCDRYVYDTVVDLGKDLSYSREAIIRRIDQLFAFLPPPDILFYIDVPEDVSMARKNDIPSIQFLRDKKKLYLEIRAYLEGKVDVIVLDGTLTKEEIESSALSEIGRKFKGGI